MNCRSTTKALMLAWALGSAWSTSLSTASEALNIGSEKQLFVGPWTDDGRDAHLVESMENVTMTMNEARATGRRLVEIDKPWEENELNFMDLRLHVLKEGDLFRMWYSAFPKFPKSGQPYSRILCYADSQDGVHWHKPNLGLWEWEGSRENNIVLPNDDFGYSFTVGEGACPFKDSNAESRNEEYKMFMKIYGLKKADQRFPGGQYALCSPDGIHWKLLSEKKVNRGPSDTQFSALWDDRIGKYIGYTRMKPRAESKAQSAYYREKYGVELRVADLVE